jgi:hypothetical protein
MSLEWQISCLARPHPSLLPPGEGESFAVPLKIRTMDQASAHEFHGGFGVLQKDDGGQGERLNAEAGTHFVG